VRPGVGKGEVRLSKELGLNRFPGQLGFEGVVVGLYSVFEGWGEAEPEIVNGA